MKSELLAILLTKILLAVGATLMVGTAIMQEVDFYLGVGLKVTAIISFFMVTIINWRKFKRAVKFWLKKW